MTDTFQNPFSVDPATSTFADRMYAMYGMLQAHQTASKVGCELELTPGIKRGFGMERWDCGTAACAAGSAGLLPWFQELARAKGVTFTVLPRGLTRGAGQVHPAQFVNDSAIWGEASGDMRALFLGQHRAYDGIAACTDRECGTSELDKRLAALTPFQVKTALRRIIIKHFGAAGAKRCDELDQHCNILSEEVSAS